MKKLICSLIVVTVFPFFNLSEASTTAISKSDQAISSVKNGIETLTISADSIIIHKTGENMYQAIFSDMDNISSEQLKNAEKSWYKNSPTSFANIPPTGWMKIAAVSSDILTVKFTGFHYDDIKHQVIINFGFLTDVRSGKALSLPKDIALNKQYNNARAVLFVITTMPTE